MKYFTISLVVLSTSLLSPQSSELKIDSGAEFFVFFGSQISSDYITINDGGGFYADDPSCIAPGTLIQGVGSLVTPVELTSFTAKLIGNKVILDWNTATEVNNYGFEVERNSTLYLPHKDGTGEEGEEWVKIGFIEGSGNSNSPKQYSFIDNYPVGGSKFFYRLKQVDADGVFEYSNVVEVEIVPDKFVLYQNYPNPFNPSTRIRYQLPTNTFVILKVYDLLGNEMITLINEENETGIYEIVFNRIGLASGTYFFRLQAKSMDSSESFTSTKKMIILQ